MVNISVMHVCMCDATSVSSFQGNEQIESRKRKMYFVLRFMKERHVYSSLFGAVVSLNLKDITYLNNIYCSIGL